MSVTLPRTQPRRAYEVHQLWACYECSTLIERPPGSTGIALCSKHQDPRVRIRLVDGHTVTDIRLM